MNTLILGYGGFGGSCVKRYSELHQQPVLVIDSHQLSEEESNAFVNYIDLGNEGALDVRRLEDMFSTYSRILFVSSLGGDSFKSAFDIITECARSLKMQTVLLCTMPYVFETERRARALENLNSISESARNLFIIDSQKTIRGDAPCADFLENVSMSVTRMVDVLSNIMERGPFQTYCQDQAYTFAVGESALFGEAVKDALSRPYFDISSRAGKILVCTDVPDPFGHEDVVAELTVYSGKIPEFVGGSGVGKNEVLLFIPISFRRHE